MKNKIITLVTSLMLAVMLVPNFTAFAATTPPVELKNSVGSSATNTTDGNDQTQGKITEYSTIPSITTTTYSSSSSVGVFATKSSWAKISMPANLILGPESADSSIYSCTFKVDFTGDIAGAQSITVTPDKSSNLTEVGGKNSTIPADVTIDGKDSTTIVANDLLNGAVVTKTGKVTAKNVTSGSYKTNINFKVVINYK